MGKNVAAQAAASLDALVIMSLRMSLQQLLVSPQTSRARLLVVNSERQSPFDVPSVKYLMCCSSRPNAQASRPSDEGMQAGTSNTLTLNRQNTDCGVIVR